MSENQVFKVGKLTVAGPYDYQIGRYAHVKEWDEEFHIKGVSHNFVYPQLWTTQLQVVRDRPINKTQTSSGTSAKYAIG